MCIRDRDRVGVGTALLLSALSVDRDTIIRDFVRTNDYVMENAVKTADMVRERTKDVRLAECVNVLLTVSEDYIRHACSAMETACGSVEAYLNERIGINERKHAELKRKFLIS